MTASLRRGGLGLLLLLAGLLFAGPPAVVQAQVASYAYWQYDAAGRLDRTVVTDVDNDGVDEFLLAIDNNTVVFLDSDGLRRWEVATEEPILDLTAINFQGPSEPGGVLIATRNHLMLVDLSGQQVWRQQIEAPPGAPPAPVVLLTSEDEAAWQSQRAAAPVRLLGIDSNGDGRDEVAVALKSGLLQLFSAGGERLWQFPDRDEFPDDARPHLASGDFNGDGRDELVYAYYLPGRDNRGGLSRLALLEADGRPRWELSVVGRLTGLSLVQFDPEGPPQIAVSTQFGRQHRLYLYDYRGAKIWRRTPNKLVTSQSMAQLRDGPALVVGTEVGTLIAFDATGRRLWERTFSFSGEPDRQVNAISATPQATSLSQPIALAVTLGTRSEQHSEATDILLLDDSGCLIRGSEAARALPPGPNCLTDPAVFPPVPAVGRGTLVDINHDGRDELLLSRFGTLELLDPGIGVPQYIAADSWRGYRLEARPQAMLVADINLNGENELLLAGDDGRLHVVSSTGVARWREDLGGAITHLGLVRSVAPEAQPTLVVVYNSDDGLTSQVELLAADGRRLWSEPLVFTTAITHLLVGDGDGERGPEIILATADSEVRIYSIGGFEMSRMPVPGRITHLALLEPAPLNRAPQIYVAVGNNRIFQFRQGDTAVQLTASFNAPIHSLHTISQERELSIHLLVLLTNGNAFGLNWRGISLWSDRLTGQPDQVLPASSLFFISDRSGNLSTLDVIASNPFDETTETSRQRAADQVMDVEIPLPRLTGLGPVSSIYHGYLDQDALPDLAIGNRNGEVRLFTGDGRFLGQFNVVTGVFGITALVSEPLQTDDLIVVADNGVVQLFAARENRPPLLINPQATVREGSYSIEVTVIDVENSDVVVTLETWEPGPGGAEAWRSQGQQTAVGGRGTLAWPVEIGGLEGPVRYRFTYDDGSHQGVVEPAAGPPPIPVSLFPELGLFALLLVGAVALAGFLLFRESQSYAFRASRFYRRLLGQPAATLALLEAEYQETHGSPDFLLSLANLARRDRNRPLAALTDGLFLLADRPEAALPIITGALSEAEPVQPAWQGLEIWQLLLEMYSALLTAPSITELSLLRPRLTDLIDQLKSAGRPADDAALLLPVLTSLRDSERVDLVDDRFVYLHEATVLLLQLQESLPERPFSSETQLIQAIVERWLGLVNAAVDELRGQAQLVVNLKTTRVAPAPEAIVALEVRNTGRAAAENIVISLTPDPAYRIEGPPESIPLLSPGRMRQVQFRIHPLVPDRFRLAFEITYDNRHRDYNRLAFADMVHLLPPVRDFSPVINPYSPGVPLRSNSTLFYGRENLFQFIAQNAGKLSQQNVLILVGQRRTGKTSAILRLDQYLPESIIPVYIDCQSLGVLPGMAAFFQDLAWLIADALATRGIELIVPEPAAWQENPARQFQRHFFPHVQSLLSEETTLLLVFDEFEAFENLVSDRILPPTLFTFLRHLMQHGRGLSFVFVGTRRLEEMSTDYWSVLFNIALYRQIGFLDEAAATRLIAEPVAPHIVYDDLAIDKILRVTAGHPYFLQLVCYTLVNRANQQQTGYVTISDVNAALEEMLRLGEVHFAYLWQRSSQTERALLTAVAHMMDRDTPFHPVDLVQYLTQYGIRLNPAAVTAGLNTLVEREIMREVRDEATTLYELKIGLVGLWVAQNKSLSKLYESDGVVEERFPRRRTQPVRSESQS